MEGIVLQDNVVTRPAHYLISPTVELNLNLFLERTYFQVDHHTTGDKSLLQRHWIDLCLLQNLSCHSSSCHCCILISHRKNICNSNRHTEDLEKIVHDVCVK
jgi:hypothetical protein